MPFAGEPLAVRTVPANDSGRSRPKPPDGGARSRPPCRERLEPVADWTGTRSAPRRSASSPGGSSGERQARPERARKRRRAPLRRRSRETPAICARPFQEAAPSLSLGSPHERVSAIASRRASLSYGVAFRMPSIGQQTSARQNDVQSLKRLLTAIRGSENRKVRIREGFRDVSFGGLFLLPWSLRFGFKGTRFTYPRGA